MTRVLVQVHTAELEPCDRLVSLQKMVEGEEV